MKKKKLIILPILLISIVLLTGCFKVIDFDTIYDDDKAISKSYNSFNMGNPQTNIKDNIFLWNSYSFWNEGNLGLHN